MFRARGNGEGGGHNQRSAVKLNRANVSARGNRRSRTEPALGERRGGGGKQGGISHQAD